ncbi:xylogen-like protein 11 [Momordica charantia]|uniref:Xylogen-like protein 11 n=1 Tax=Momordica charantia TaxID=3673 RepID=A0A6J1DSU5_MOMCH|nr:xylogen-like protein 11 [Momordica charantia]
MLLPLIPEPLPSPSLFNHSPPLPHFRTRPNLYQNQTSASQISTMAASISAPIFLLLAAIITSAAARGGAPKPPVPAPAAMDCLTTLLNMSDCLSYVSIGSKDHQPDKNCCPELAGLVESSPQCLCQLLSDPQKTGLDIDVDRALNLPSACKVSTPPISLCSLLGYPVTSPASPAPAPTTLPPGVQPPDVGGLPTNATPGNSGNRASSIDRLHLAFPIGLALAFLPKLL